MLPARVRAAHLNVHEPIGRVELTDERAPAQRDAEPRHPEVVDAPGTHRRRPREEAQAERGR